MCEDLLAEGRQMGSMLFHPLSVTLRCRPTVYALSAYLHTRTDRTHSSHSHNVTDGVFKLIECYIKSCCVLSLNEMFAETLSTKVWFYMVVLVVCYVLK